MRIALALILLLLVAGCKPSGPSADVRIETELGNIEIHLYPETPRHRENFLKLARQGYYNGTAFHRIIKEFMVQGGDSSSRRLLAPDSVQQRDSLLGQQLGKGGPGYELDAEIVPNRFHKRGALAAARMGDEYNPERKSSGSQFYIVQGRKLRLGELDTLEYYQLNRQTQDYMRVYIQRPENKWILDVTRDQMALQRLHSENPDSFQRLSNRLNEEGNRMREQMSREVVPARFTLDQRRIYSTLGGTPQLDQQYTVFGEVVSGMEVIDKLATQPTNPVTGVPVKATAIKVVVLAP